MAIFEVLRKFGPTEIIKRDELVFRGNWAMFCNTSSGGPKDVIALHAPTDNVARINQIDPPPGDTE